MGRISRTAWTSVLLAPALLAMAAPGARAQGPQVDVEGPPGAAESSGRLGSPLGSPGESSFNAVGAAGTTGGQVQGPVSNRPGPSVSRVPLGLLNQPPQRPAMTPETSFRPQVLEPETLPRYGSLEEPLGPEEPEPINGLTLDGAIERLVRANLNLMALRFEVPMAEADVLTAGLRANPIFYADSQLVPYGHYSNQRPGGQTQYDVNVTLPLDIWRKRKARVLVQQAARRVTEAQLQDAVRNQIDNLYTAYVDVVAAEETLRFSRAYLAGITRLFRLKEALRETGAAFAAEVDVIRAQVEQAQLQINETEQALAKSTRTLALLLDVPKPEIPDLRLNASLRDVRPLPLSLEDLTRLALDSRPDLLSFRLGLVRANAEVHSARAERYSDVYLLYQPYTFQDNRPMGLKSAYSYAIGATVNLPVFNRNQGNVLKTQLNARQTQVELAAQERQVVYDVEEAVREFEVSRNAVLELEREVVPAARRVRNTEFERFRGGETSAFDFLEAQRNYNETVRQYRDALVRHRRSMLDLNTAVGTRVLP